MDPLTLAVTSAALFCTATILLFRSRHVRGLASVRGLAGPPVVDEPERVQGDISRVFWIALAIRIFAAIAIAATGLTDYFAPDHYGYEYAGRSIAADWIGNDRYLNSPGADPNRPYHYYNAVFFYLMGEVAPWILRLLNCLAGAAAVPIAQRVAKSIYGSSAGTRAAWLVAFMPSLIIWSAVNIRDAWAGLAILWTVLAAVGLRERISATATLNLLLALALLGGIRGYMFVIIALGIVLGYASTLGGNVVRNYVAGLIAALVCVYLYNSLGFGKDLLEGASFEALSYQRQAGTVAAQSAYFEHVDISTPQKALAFLPFGATYFLFAPFPWDYRNLRQAITLPEMLMWWFFAARFLVPGLLEGFRSRVGHTTTVMSVVLLSVATYGLVEGNIGTAYRHRAQILPLLLILVAGGMVRARQRAPANALAQS